VVQTFTPHAVSAYPFLCTDSSCGTGHANMTGLIQVEPSLPLARDLRLRAHRPTARPDAASTAGLL
jgi:heme/copper-type cytochrome/quinol oxidase subunit 2